MEEKEEMNNVRDLGEKHAIQTTERFIICIGKFGAYFHDLKLQEDMTLEAVKNRLNECYEVNKFKMEEGV